MRVYASDIKDWSAELKASGKTVKPSHPYDLENNDKLLWFFFFPIESIVRLLVELWP